jgi:hypothetical protein
MRWRHWRVGILLALVAIFGLIVYRHLYRRLGIELRTFPFNGWTG